MTAGIREKLIALTEPLLGGLGYELIDLEYAAGRTQALLRFFIDREQSAAGPDVSIEDCERVSRELSALLDVEDPVPGAYTLEVSSPGHDRVLRTAAHFLRFAGERVHVELGIARDGRRRYTGQLRTVGTEGIELDVDGIAISVPFAAISRARLAPIWPVVAKRK